MARISSFPTDNNVQTGDKVLGTDQSGDTKNYEIGVVGEFYAKSNLIIVSGQIGAQFITDDSAFGYGKWMFSDGGGGNGQPLSGLTQITIHKAHTESKDALEYIKRVFDDRVRLLNIEDVNKDYMYTVETIVDHPTVANAYQIDLIPISGNQSATLENEVNYAWSAVDGDKNYVHTQGSASATWSITHNLNKKPSVSVVNSSDEIVVGEVTYTNDNSLTINFSGGFTGKAYLN